MTKNLKTHRTKVHSVARFLRRIGQWYLNYWHKNWWHKVVVIVLLLIGLTVGTMYGIARWYIATQNSKPLELGASFIPDYAEQFDLDSKQTLDAMLHDLGVKHLRLVSYWKDIEPTKGTYNFSELDWQFEKINEAGAKVSLSIGLRQPRWPECHEPKWVDIAQPRNQWQPALEAYITAVINRYKDNPALESYKLENEYFLTVFGECKNFDRERLINEYNLVKRLDPAHSVIIARSNNALGTPLYEPTPDAFGVSVYKRVWDATVTRRYVEYPFPAWFYASLAGTEKIIKGRETVIHELQAEPWPPNGKPIKETPLAELNKSLDAKRLEARFNYGRATGIRKIDLWGAEYWYYIKEKRNDPSLWNIAKQEFHAN